jgi:hypothetical protein
MSVMFHVISVLVQTITGYDAKMGAWYLKKKQQL